MKMFHSLKGIFFFVVFILSAQICAMDLFLEDIPDISLEPVEVFFLPQDTSMVRSRLDSLLDNAKQRVLLAMYWITDQKIIDKLIALKKKGIDIQVIFDESMDKFEKLTPVINQFLDDDVASLVFPSKSVKGVMHHKFMIIDNNKVWTGSANFTPTALEPKKDYKNNENILIFHSDAMVKKYTQSFVKLKKEIFELYVRIIADNWANKLPDWLKRLAPIVYKDDSSFKRAIEGFAKNANPTQQNRLKKLFHKKNKSASFFQAKELRKAGYKQYKIDNMSSKEGSRRVGEFVERKERKKERQYKQRYSPYSQRFESPTQAQINFLESRNIPTSGMSKQEASKRIGSIKQQEKKEKGTSFPKYSSQRRFPSFEPPTDKQRKMLNDYGISTEGMSKQEATQLIGDIMQGSSPYSSQESFSY